MPTIHKKIAERLILTLYEKYQERKMFYERHNSSHAPQNVFIPKRATSDEPVKRGSEEHVRWLFFATLTDRRQISNEVYKAHCEISKFHPELYTEEVLAYILEQEQLEKMLVKYRVGVPRQSAKYWMRCAITLFQNFQGNPLLLYSSCGNTVEGIQQYRKDFEKKHGVNPLPGYGPKISSLYALFLAEMELLSFPKDAFPVDIHVQRIFLQTGALTISKRMINESLEKIIRPFICEVCKKHDLDKIDLAHAFWFLGSTLCTNCYRRGDIVHLCPVYDMCTGPVNTKEYFARGFWNQLHEPIAQMRKGDAKIFRLEEGPLFAQK